MVSGNAIVAYLKREADISTIFTDSDALHFGFLSCRALQAEEVGSDVRGKTAQR
jgi:hypothetical protein